MKKKANAATKELVKSIFEDQIPFYELPELIKRGRLTFDGDKTDLRLHSDDMFRWGAKTKRDYEIAERKIDKIEYKGKGWTIYAGYDVSGFNYWMKKMEETNYMMLTVCFDTETIDRSEIEAIDRALDSALADAEALENKYNYNPCPYDK